MMTCSLHCIVRRNISWSGTQTSRSVVSRKEREREGLTENGSVDASEKGLRSDCENYESGEKQHRESEREEIERSMGRVSSRLGS